MDDSLKSAFSNLFQTTKKKVRKKYERIKKKYKVSKALRKAKKEIYQVII